MTPRVWCDRHMVRIQRHHVSDRSRHRWLADRAHQLARNLLFLNVPLAAVVVVLSLRFMSESRDDTRGDRVDWTGATLAVIGSGGSSTAFSRGRGPA
jgi:hypothetical protein